MEIDCSKDGMAGLPSFLSIEGCEAYCRTAAVLDRSEGFALIEGGERDRCVRREVMEGLAQAPPENDPNQIPSNCLRTGARPHLAGFRS